MLKIDISGNMSSRKGHNKRKASPDKVEKLPEGTYFDKKGFEIETFGQIVVEKIGDVGANNGLKDHVEMVK